MCLALKLSAIKTGKPPPIQAVRSAPISERECERYAAIIFTCCWIQTGGPGVLYCVYIGFPDLPLLSQHSCECGLENDYQLLRAGKGQAYSFRLTAEECGQRPESMLFFWLVVLRLHKDSESGCWFKTDLWNLLIRLPAGLEDWCIVKRSSYWRIMLRLKELDFINAISTLHLSLALLRQLRTALSRRKKRPVVPAGSRGTASRGWAGTLTKTQTSRGQAQIKRAGELG